MKLKVLSYDQHSHSFLVRGPYGDEHLVCFDNLPQEQQPIFTDQLIGKTIDVEALVPYVMIAIEPRIVEEES